MFAQSVTWRMELEVLGLGGCRVRVRPRFWLEDSVFLMTMNMDMHVDMDDIALFRTNLCIWNGMSDDDLDLGLWLGLVGSAGIWGNGTTRSADYAHSTGMEDRQ